MAFLEEDFHLPVSAHAGRTPFTLDVVVATWLREEVLCRIDNMQVCLVEPGGCPIWTDFSPDEQPERALLMAMVAVTADDQRDRLPAAIRALDQIARNNRVIYMEMLMSHFGEEMLMDAARQIPVIDEEFEEGLRNYQPTERELGSFMYTRAHRAGCEAGRREGQLAAQARMVLMLLERRGLAIPPRVRTRVLDCRDSDQLDRWFDRALHIEQADALLDEPAPL